MNTSSSIESAVVLAAGFGRRMQPLTISQPKPLMKLGGKPLIDHVLDRLVAIGVRRAIVNVHYLADHIETHLATRTDIDITISDERAAILDTGGGVKKALNTLGSDPVFVIASDTVWLEGPRSNLADLAAGFDPQTMDMRLLVASTAGSIGTGGHGDFSMDPVGRLKRREEREAAPFTYASALVTTPALYVDTPDGPFSNNLLFDRAIERDRLFGQRLDGIWMHIGTPAALADAEEAVAERID